MEVLCWLLYFVIGVVFTSLLIRFDVLEMDEDLACMVSPVAVMLWPLVILAAIIAGLCTLVFNCILYLGGKK